MRGTIILDKKKLYSIIEILEATEKVMGPVEAMEISFGEILPGTATSANWIKPIMQTSDVTGDKDE